MKKQTSESLFLRENKFLNHHTSTGPLGTGMDLRLSTEVSGSFMNDAINGSSSYWGRRLPFVSVNCVRQSR